MAGYLDTYGAGDERREKRIKRVVVVVVAVLIVGGILYFLFKNFREEHQARQFLELLQKHDYQAAYRLWGCTESNPCRDYPFPEFMKDWGPQSARADVGSYKIAKSRACGSGVILTVDFGKSQEEKLWVQKDDLTIGFSPWPGCPPGR